MNWTMKFKSTFCLAIFAVVFAFSGAVAQAQIPAQGFDVVPVPGWTTQNNSIPVGSTGWFPGNSAVFPSQAGGPNAYIGANFNNTSGANTISNWVITPQTALNNGDVIKFWTRTITANPFPDRLQVRISTAGASTNVGTGPVGVGDFTLKVLDINEFYGTAYPEVWTEFTITLSGLPAGANGRIAFRYFVEDGGPAGDNSNFIGIDTFSFVPGTPFVPGDAPIDFNGDGRTDYALVRNTNVPAGQLTWFYNLNNSANPTVGFAWGLTSDTIISEDFDNDDKDDIAVWRPGAAGVASFYIHNSATNTVRVEAFGQTGDDPTVVDDYNGDGRADIAVFRSGAPSIWYYRTVANGPTTFVRWGTTGDFPAPGDYDGNGSADFGVQRSAGGAGAQGQFWRLLSTGVVQPVVTFGLATDVVVPGDWDGDGKTDIATVRGVGGAIQWHYLSSLNGSVNFITFGTLATDVITQGDYNGDGRTDAAVWRPSTTTNQSAFYSRSTASGAVSIFALGAQGDVPPANFNTH